MPTLSRQDQVLVVDMGDGENRMTHDFCAEMLDLIDEAESVEGPKALVTTATGKHWSLGLDTDYLPVTDDVPRYVGHTMQVCARVLTFPAPTAAAINGHAFGLGAFFQLSHDHRVMRQDRGFVCWPEVALGMTFPHPLQELNRARLPADTLHEAHTTGRRYGGADAVAAGVVHEAVPEDRVLEAALARVTPLVDTAGAVLGQIKRDLYAAVLAVIESNPHPVRPERS